MAEDGGMTHETVSRHRPHATVLLASGGRVVEATEVSLSVVDRPENGVWRRRHPTIQVEGGSYSLSEAHLLVRAVTELLARTSPLT